ncbi:MAG: hypothetical protein ACHQU0_01005 [Candidatus Paceibacteria bacterium]
MLSIEQCRKLLPHGEEMSDEKVAEARRLLYELGYLFIESYMEDKGMVEKGFELPRMMETDGADAKKKRKK